MNTYNCPRCGGPSTVERCPTCGRGPEPLLARLSQLDAVLATMPATLHSRAAVEAERVGVLQDLTQVAARYLAEAERQARSAVPTPTAAPMAQTGAQQAAPATPPGGAPRPQPAPSLPYQEPPRTPPGGAFPQPPEGGEVGSKTVQNVLLTLGGILVAAALIIFTAVAWRNMGNAGRAGVLGGVTLLLLAIPFAFKRFRLWATAETFAALAGLALWCTTLAGYYLYRPPGSDFGPETVGAWTVGVLFVLAAYRGFARLSATGWVMLPLALIGAAYAAAGSIGTAVVLMLAISAALGAAAWLTTRLPAHFTTSDVWAGRLLTCAAVIAACSAGLRAAFGLADPVVPPIAAAVAVLAAGNLVGVHFAQRLGMSLNTMLIAGSAAGSLVVCAWVLATRSGSPELVVPSLALLGAAILSFSVTGSRRDDWAFGSAVTAGLCAVAAFAAVTFDAPDLSAYFVAFLAARLVAPLIADPLGNAFRHASYVVGAGTAVTASFIALSGIWTMWSVVDPLDVFTWEIPIVLVGLGFASMLLPARNRADAAALAATFAVASAAVLIWHSDQDRWDAVPFFGFVVCGLIGLAAAMASQTLAGRCCGWIALTLWASVAGLTASGIEWLSPTPGWTPFWLTVTAAAMLVIAVGAPRRSRPDRVLAAVLSHVLAGITIGITVIGNWLSGELGGDPIWGFTAGQFGVYALALLGAAIMAPVRKWGYVIAAICTGTLGWWSLLTSLDVATLEFFTAPPAAVVFLIGLWRLEKRPEAGSWATLALPIIFGIAPSLILAIDGGNELRRVGVGAAAIAVIIAGLARRWQAPLVLGSIVLAILTINEIALLWHHIPVWIPPAIGGAILISAGATFERRRRDLRRIREGLKAMR